MQKLCKYLLASSAGGAMLFVSSTAFAGETPGTFKTSEPLVRANPDIKVENQNQQKGIAQVTSVSQLSDVQPTDWAFQALQSLVERYGCIAGYPDSTYRGNRTLTRYEFAAGLNACLTRVNELIASSGGNLLAKDDLAKLQKLQEQFGAELVTLRGRVDKLEPKVEEIKAQQFSTTTKLNGEAVIALTSVFAGQDASGAKISRNPILGNRVRLNFDTSFTGKDLLRTRLQASNLGALRNTTLTPEGDLRFAGAGDGKNGVGIDALFYQFPVSKQTTLTLEANAGAIDDFTNTVNPFLDGDGGSGALTHFGTRNPIYYHANGAGLGLKHEFNKNLELSLGYLANDPANPQSKGGLFNGPYGAIAQLTIKPSKQVTIGLTYLNSYNNDFTANGSTGSNRANLRYAIANQFGANLPVSSNSYGVEASFQISPKFILGGWAGYTNTKVLSSDVIPRGTLDIWNYAVTLAFPDLGKTGNLGGIIVGMEPKVTSVSNNLKNTVTKDGDTSLHVEGFYQYKISDNISITPAVILLTSPDHNDRNDSIVIGAVRTTFTF